MPHRHRHIHTPHHNNGPATKFRRREIEQESSSAWVGPAAVAVNPVGSIDDEGDVLLLPHKNRRNAKGNSRVLKLRLRPISTSEHKEDKWDKEDKAGAEDANTVGESKEAQPGADLSHEVVCGAVHASSRHLGLIHRSYAGGRRFG